MEYNYPYTENHRKTPKRNKVNFYGCLLYCTCNFCHYTCLRNYAMYWCSKNQNSAPHSWFLITHTMYTPWTCINTTCAHTILPGTSTQTRHNFSLNIHNTTHIPTYIHTLHVYTYAYITHTCMHTYIYTQMCLPVVTARRAVI